MKLQNVKEDSWVMYNNKPYFVIYIPNGTKRRVLRNNDGNMKVSVKAKEAHIHHYSKENVHAVFTGDFFAWENISRLKEL